MVESRIEDRITSLIDAAMTYAHWDRALQISPKDAIVQQGYDESQLSLFHAKQNLKDSIFWGER